MKSIQQKHVTDHSWFQGVGKGELVTTLSEFFCGKFVGRGTIIKPHESQNTPSHDRFMPVSKFITEDNRFSPAGVEWLYLAVGDTQEIIQECAEKECRVKSGDRFAFCNFQVNENYHSIPYFTSTIKRTVCEIFSQYVREVSSASANFHDGRKAACATVGAQAALFYRKLFICRFCCHFSTCGCAVLFLLLRS